MAHSQRSGYSCKEEVSFKLLPVGSDTLSSIRMSKEEQMMMMDDFL
jgi:hypothetical protein